MPAQAGTAFAGGGFGTLQHAIAGPRQPPPESVSGRGLMRRELPAIYQEDDFTMRFVGGFERVLDPIAALLDGLPAHLSADHAPRALLELLAAWLGLSIEEGQRLEQQRETVAAAGELARRRGTAGGLRLALRLAFPDLALRVEDTGGVLWGRSDEAAPASAARSFVVSVEEPVDRDRLAAIARCIEREKPVDTTYRLLTVPRGGNPS